MHLPLSQLLAIGRSPNQVVAIRGAETLRFSQFHADVAHNAARLAAARCRTGAPVCRDSYWFMVGFLALCHAGAAIVMPSNTQAGTLDALAGDCDLLLSDPTMDMPSTFFLEKGRSEPASLAAYHPDGVTVKFFTSGSTGAPKKVTRTAGDLEREVCLVAPILNADLNDRLVSGTVSHQHVYGLLFRLLWPLSYGRPFSAETHEVWETVLDEMQPGGILVTSPAHLSRMGGIAPLTPALAPSQVLSAGAPLASNVAHDAEKILGVFPTEIFGSTETGACAVRDTQKMDAEWTPLPGVCFRETPEGMLRIQSPALPDDTWIETADRVEVELDGSFRFRGRADRIVKIEGKRVSLPEVERQLSDLPWVTGAAATVVPALNSRLAAVVVLGIAGKEKQRELGDFRFSRLLRRALAATQEPAGLPRLWRFVEELPVSNLGKRRDQDLLDLFTNDRAS